MSENTLELKCVQLAMRRHVISRKLASPGRRGTQDRMFVDLVSGRLFFVEFKNPNGKGKESAHQRTWRVALQMCNVETYLIDDFETFKRILINENAA